MLVEGQSAILGVGRGRELPRFRAVGGGGGGGGGCRMGNSDGRSGGDAIERRLISTFSWTADHRVLDGATVARFAEEVAGYLSVPGRMVVGMR